VLPDLTDTSLVLSALLELRRVRGRRGTARRTGPEPSGPAALPQRLRYLGSGGASLAGHLVPVISQRRAAPGSGVVVASSVTTALMFGVRLLAVEFHHQAVAPNARRPPPPRRSRRAGFASGASGAYSASFAAALRR